MTESKQVLPGHETQSEEMNCPNCGRFVGAVAKCPYCGSKVEKRMSLVAIRWAAVLLATIGLFLLYLMAKHREIPVVMLGNVQPTMNFGQIRVVGQVASDARTFRNGGMGFNVTDGTGTIMVFASAKQAKELADLNLVPKTGDAINFAGGLNISDEESSMRLLSVKELHLERAPAASVKLADVTEALAGSSVVVAGKVTDLLVPPADSKRPYTLKLQDDSGEKSVKFWQSDYDRIQGKDVLNGSFVRARVVVGSYEGKIDLKLSSGADLEILDGPPTDAAPPQRAAQQAAAAYQQKAAPRELSRGRAVQAGSLSVAAVTPDLNNKTVRVRGRVDSVRAPAEGTQQPFSVMLKEGDATLRVVYWPTADAVVAVKPTPGALFEFEGVVSVYEGKAQLKVESGYKIKLVDDVPASAPAVDESQAVPVSSIAPADQGQIRVVKGVLGPARSLKSGVAFSLTDASGSIDLVLWNSLVPEDVQAPLEEGVEVAAVGEVGSYEGQLQVKASSGHSVMVIR